MLELTINVVHLLGDVTFLPSGRNGFTKSYINEEVLKHGGRDTTWSSSVFRRTKSYEAEGKPLLQRLPQSIQFTCKGILPVLRRVW